MSIDTTNEKEGVRTLVREGYGRIARAEPSAGGGCCGPGATCGPGTDASAHARQLGYTEAELALLPEGANLGLSCGNPAALAGLAPGEVVLDLGSGAGFDCFLIGPKVGAQGRVIGVDMTADMLARARQNRRAYRERTGLDNVEFRLGEIEHLPLADGSVDVVVSNCVLNLSPDKAQVWREIARVLRPGGRVAVSDLALLRPLPDAVRGMVEALVGCVAGASLVGDTERDMHAAGLVGIELARKGGYVEAMDASQDPLYGDIASELPAGTGVADFVTSLDICARKPLGAARCC